MTHRSSTVSYPHLCNYYKLIDERIILAAYRCKDVANPLPHHGRCLSGHIHPVHCARRTFRPLKSRSFPIFSIDSFELSYPLIVTFDILRPYHFSWLWFQLTLLEAPVIHFPVFIAHYQTIMARFELSCRFLSCFPSLPPHSLARVPSLEFAHRQTQYPLPVSSVNSFLVLFSSLPSLFNQLYIFTFTLKCISDYAPSHSFNVLHCPFSVVFYSSGLSLWVSPCP
jgi:hypothetical protein